MKEYSIHYDSDVVSKFAQGTVVRVKGDSYFGGLIGHVQSFSLNSTMEVTVRVSLCNGEVQSFHYSNIELL